MDCKGKSYEDCPSVPAITVRARGLEDGRSLHLCSFLEEPWSTAVPMALKLVLIRRVAVTAILVQIIGLRTMLEGLVTVAYICKVVDLVERLSTTELTSAVIRSGSQALTKNRAAAIECTGASPHRS